jgi:hypothetical protein
MKRLQRAGILLVRLQGTLLKRLEIPHVKNREMRYAGEMEILEEPELALEQPDHSCRRQHIFLQSPVTLRR